MEEKTCSRCKLIKPITEFSPRPERKSGYRSKCKACERELKNRYNSEHREHVKNLETIWIKNNPDKRKKIRDRYNNSEKCKINRRKCDKKRLKSHNEYARKRYFSDPQWNLNMKLRRRLKNILNQRKISKSEKTMKLLGCTYAKYQKHIESLFTSGMTWEKVLNGEIHIDHIIPCASFDLTDPEQQKECFHYTNLQPLWATTREINGITYQGNLNKSNKI